MQHVDPQTLRIEFSQSAEARRILRFQRQEQKRMRHERIDAVEQLADDFVTLAQTAIAATAEQITALDDKLTHYEALTTAEIMRLQEQLDTLLEQRDDMLAKATVLPDGRRVFKSEDGLRVIDEHGMEIGIETIDPRSIDDLKPRWEAYSGILDSIDDRRQRLTELHEFQTKLDDIRERFDKGEITADELKTLEKELERSVPLSLRARDIALNIEEVPAKATPEFTAAASNKINLDTLELDAPVLGS
ncbi:MAG: hypothetical protein GY927_23815 [bacterium]|nr:hypothetical protein [bacterium]